LRVKEVPVLKCSLPFVSGTEAMDRLYPSTIIHALRLLRK
jgi:hypothetical protein